MQNFSFFGVLQMLFEFEDSTLKPVLKK